MSRGTITVDERLARYLDDINRPETDVQRRLREQTGAMPQAGMQIGHNQASFMAFLVQSIGARRALEIGTFTGYSALAVAAALPADGKLICCDVSEEWTRLARRAWAEARLADRIDLRLGPAAQTLDRLIADGQAGGFDFAFIDADKENYDRYYEQCLVLIRKGGLIAVDNVLWDGAVADPKNDSVTTKAIRALNSKMREDPRIDYSLIPVGDGMGLARVR
ncbi:MAG TPA: class I SAM-dependent methyltransferase [Alphaproteobacteria bacterium]|nr:class I SAM-dependent methyltransferase [Alphaproteobacteria bacterium]